MMNAPPRVSDRLKTTELKSTCVGSLETFRPALNMGTIADTTSNECRLRRSYVQS